MREQFLRQSFLGPDSERALGDARVAIIGLCGGGSPITQQLAHIGIGHLYLFDPDHADESNRNRMVGLTRDDAQRSALKTDVMLRLTKAINPDIEVVAIPKRWQEQPDLLKECDAIFGCVDSYIARDELERFARRFVVPYVDIGMDVHGTPPTYAISGQVILSLPGELCMRCFGFITDQRLVEEAKRYGDAGGRPQVIWPNGTLASIAVGKFVSLIAPWHRGLIPPLYTEYDGNRMLAFPSLKLRALSGCVCDHYTQSGSLGDVEW
jgi:hypothetical protein